jgi:hypothetical protein
MDRSRQRGAWIALMVALLWAVVGCGAEESASYDRDGSVQAVEQGKQALVELLNGQPDTVPYYELTEIGVVFEQAGELDPPTTRPASGPPCSRSPTFWNATTPAPSSPGWAGRG